MCSKEEPSSYFDFDGGLSKYTVVMNHLITNEIDEYQIMILYILVMVLFSYQCMKINEHA